MHTESSGEAIDRWAHFTERRRPYLFLPGVREDERSLLEYVPLMRAYGIAPPEPRIVFGFTGRELAAVLLVFLVTAVLGLPLRWAAALGLTAGGVLRVVFAQRSASDVFREIRELGDVAHEFSASVPPRAGAAALSKLERGASLILGIWLIAGANDLTQPGGIADAMGLVGIAAIFIAAAVSGYDPFQRWPGSGRR
jgi:hypothetical protein